MQIRLPLGKKKQLFLFIHRPEEVSVSDVDCTSITNLETFTSIDTQLLYHCKSTNNSRVLFYLTRTNMDPVDHCVLNHISTVAVFRSNFQGAKKKKKCPHRHASLVNNGLPCFTIYKCKVDYNYQLPTEII